MNTGFRIDAAAEHYFALDERGFAMDLPQGRIAGRDFPRFIQETDDLRMVEFYRAVFTLYNRKIAEFLSLQTPAKNESLQAYKRSLCMRDGFSSDQAGLTRALVLCQERLEAKIALTTLPTFFDEQRVIPASADVYFVVPQFEDFLMQQQLQFFGTSRIGGCYLKELIPTEGSLLRVFSGYHKDALYIVEGVPQFVREDEKRLFDVLSDRFMQLKKHMVKNKLEYYPIEFLPRRV